MSTLTDGVTTVTLDDGLTWADQWAWAPVEQTAQRTITGALIVSAAQRVAGQPITLAAEAEDKGWISRAALAQCRAWAAVAGQVLTLNYRGTDYTVIWRHQDGAIEAQPVMPWTDDQADDDFRATLRLMRI